MASITFGNPIPTKIPCVNNDNQRVGFVTDYRIDVLYRTRKVGDFYITAGCISYQSVKECYPLLPEDLMVISTYGILLRKRVNIAKFDDFMSTSQKSS